MVHISQNCTHEAFKKDSGFVLIVECLFHRYSLT